MSRFLLVIAAVLSLAWSPHASASEAVKLRYGQAFSGLTTIYSLPVLIAYRQGFFAREGLDFGQILIPGGGENMIAALQDGTVDITHVPTPFLIRSVLAGSDAIAVAAEFNNAIYSLVAKPEIATFADLKGKLVGLADEESTISISTRKLLALKGLGAGDFRVRIVSGTPERLSCLQRGACDAVPLGQPHDFIAVSQGFRLLGYTNEAVSDLLYTVTAARRSWAQTHRATLVSYLRALGAAFRFIREPANRDDAVKAIVESTRFSEASAQQTLELLLEPKRNVLPRQGEIDLRGLNRVIAMMGESGSLKPPLPHAEQFVDLQYLRAAGFQ